jgi:hypothetical protein
VSFVTCGCFGKLCGCFGNSVVVLVIVWLFSNMCTCIYCVSYFLYCVFLYCFVYVYLFLFILAVLV